MDEVDVRIRVRSVSRAGRYKVVSGSCRALSRVTQNVRWYTLSVVPPTFPVPLEVVDPLQTKSYIYINTAVMLGTPATYQLLPVFLVGLLLGSSTVLLIIFFLFRVSRRDGDGCFGRFGHNE
jgi:hypothetical protein